MENVSFKQIGNVTGSKCVLLFVKTRSTAIKRKLIVSDQVSLLFIWGTFQGVGGTLTLYSGSYSKAPNTHNNVLSTELKKKKKHVFQTILKWINQKYSNPIHAWYVCFSNKPQCFSLCWSNDDLMTETDVWIFSFYLYIMCVIGRVMPLPKLSPS